MITDFSMPYKKRLRIQIRAKDTATLFPTQVDFILGIGLGSAKV